MRFIEVIFIFFLFFVFGCGQSDREVYEKAKLKDTIEGYHEFLQKYPKSEFRVSAKNQIKEIKDKEAREAYENAKLVDTTEGYEEFIKKYPNSEFRKSAKNQIEKIKEKEAPCYGIELGAWEYLKRNYEWESHRYRAQIKNVSNRNKVVFFKYKPKGSDTWHPVTDVNDLGNWLTTFSSAIKVKSGDITYIEAKIEDIKKPKTVEIALDRCE